MRQSIGWRAAVDEILDVGFAVRNARPFDEQARARDVARLVAEARRFPLWLPVLAIPALLLPAGWLWAGMIVLFWGVEIYRAIERAHALELKLAEETARLRAEAARDAEQLAAVLSAANDGHEASLDWLLARWLECRTAAIRHFTAQLTGSGQRGWVIVGDAVRRDAIPSGTPRVGRGGRTVFDKRKAAEIDEDLTELNAAAVLSVLAALFCGPTPQRVSVRIVIPGGDTGELIPWVTLMADVDERWLRQVSASMDSPAEVIRRVGGDVGRCRRQRLVAAREVHATTQNSHSATPPSIPSSQARHGARASAVTIGGHGEASRSRAETIPPAHSYTKPITASPSNAVPTPGTVRGEFSTVARRFATYAGDPSARFVPFQVYWPTYAHMTAAQLTFYFKWRNAVRHGEVPRTDLGYLFVHVYELLHLMGAGDAVEAGQQLELLWTNYRSTFPTLDSYLVRWVVDLYATELDTNAVMDFIRRALAISAMPGEEEMLFVTDQCWASGDYVHMSRASMIILTSDPRFGDNKFCRKHNSDGWVDQAYRKAFEVADHAYQAKYGVTPREATIIHGGTRLLAREAFRSAVYGWKRKRVVLGKVPVLTDGSPAIHVFRNAARYAENILRKERGFTAKLRGVEVEPDIARELDVQFAGYVRATRPKPKVIIDFAKARHLARESVAVRERLLEGMEEEPEETLPVSPAPSEETPAASASLGLPAHLVPDSVPHGLLTDLTAIQSMLAGIPAPARGMLVALADHDWEVPEDEGVLMRAADGALVGPLVDEINQRALDAVGDVLIVHEGALLVVQEDFRDEVYWVLRGTLDGFDPAPGASSADAGQKPVAVPPVIAGRMPDAAGFGPVELEALAIVAAAKASVMADLTVLARRHATMPLAILEGVNECAIDSPYGDLVVDTGATPPALMEDAGSYVMDLLTRVQPFLASNEQTDGAITTRM